MAIVLCCAAPAAAQIATPGTAGSGGPSTLAGDVTGQSNANIATQAKSAYELWTNNGATGTGTNLLVKSDGAGAAETITTADTSRILGVCKSGCGTSGTATIQIEGLASGVFDGATTANDYVCASTTVAGDVHDCGSAQPSNTQLIGVIPSTNGAGGTYTFDLFPPGEIATASTAPGGGGKNDVTVTNVTISGATTLALPKSGHSIENLTLAATATITIPQGQWAGQFMEIVQCENGTGGFTPTYAAIAGLTLHGTFPTPTTTASKCDVLGISYVSATVAYLTGYIQNE